MLMFIAMNYLQTFFGSFFFTENYVQIAAIIMCAHDGQLRFCHFFWL